MDTVDHQAPNRTGERLVLTENQEFLRVTQEIESASKTNGLTKLVTLPQEVSELKDTYQSGSDTLWSTTPRVLSLRPDSYLNRFLGGHNQVLMSWVGLADISGDRLIHFSPQELVFTQVGEQDTNLADYRTPRTEIRVRFDQSGSNEITAAGLLFKTVSGFDTKKFLKALEIFPFFEQTERGYAMEYASSLGRLTIDPDQLEYIVYFRDSRSSRDIDQVIRAGLLPKEDMGEALKSVYWMWDGQILAHTDYTNETLREAVNFQVKQVANGKADMSTNADLVEDMEVLLAGRDGQGKLDFDVRKTLITAMPPNRGIYNEFLRHLRLGEIRVLLSSPNQTPE